jgi:hypothetical protein
VSPAVESAARQAGLKLRTDWPLLGVVPATGMHLQMQPLARLTVLAVLLSVLLWQITTQSGPKTAPAAKASPKPKTAAPAAAPAARPAVKKAPAKRPAAGKPGTKVPVQRRSEVKS